MALRNRRDGNKEAIQAFANQFDPPLDVVQTRAVGGQAVTNGWMAARHDPETELGVTAVVWGGGHMKVWIEVQTTAAEAASFGMFFRDVMLDAVPDDGLKDMAQLADQSGIPDLARGVTDETYTHYSGYEELTPTAATPVFTEEVEFIQAPVEVVDQTEERRTREPAGLISDRMEARPAVPNPGFIDMTELHPSEQHALITAFPELKFRVDQSGQRHSFDGVGWRGNDGAGFCSERQLAHVRLMAGQAKMADNNAVLRRMQARRRLPAAAGVAGAVAGNLPDEPDPEVSTPMGAKPKPNCSHVWVRNSIGGGSTCSKCGGFEAAPSTRERQAAINAERRLRDLVNAEVKCLTERGAHSLVVVNEGGQRLGVCQFCGTEVQEAELPALEAPVASDGVVE